MTLPTFPLSFHVPNPNVNSRVQPTKMNGGVHTLQTYAPKNAFDEPERPPPLSGSLMAEDDDDDTFGDFKFVTSPISHPNNKPQDDDDWGDFIHNFSSNKQDFGFQTSQFNGFFNTQNPSSTQQQQHSFFDPLGALMTMRPVEPRMQPIESGKNFGWEKVKGALPNIEQIFFDPLSGLTDLHSMKPVEAQVDSKKKPRGDLPKLEQQNFFDPLNGFTDHHSIKPEIQSQKSFNSDLNSPEKRWEKPRGALPLSFFGDDEEEEEESDPVNLSKLDDAAKDVFESKSVSPVKTQLSFGSGNGFNDLIVNLYGQTSPNKVEKGEILNPALENGTNLNSAIENGTILNSVGENGSNLIPSGENGDFDEDDWEFMEAGGDSGVKEDETVSSLWEIQMEAAAPSQPPPPPPPPPPPITEANKSEIQENGKGLENGRGALPVSLFSNGKMDSDDSLFCEDVFPHTPASTLKNEFNSRSFNTNVSLNDLIYNLYSQAEHNPALGSTQERAENGFSLPQQGSNFGLANDENDFDDGSWEFKDASLETRTEDPSSAGVGHVHQKCPTESKMKDFVDFYATLKEESCLIALGHLEGLKNAEKVAAVSAENARASILREEIQAAYKKLYQENVVPKEVNVKEHSVRSFCMNELLEAIKESKFHVLESEYQLSQRISSAEEDLRSAIALFEHAVSMLNILTLRSMEEELSYTGMWSRMISACAQELNHGASIWKQGFEKNVNKQILSATEGQRYAIALGEIYRVVGVLRASATLYKPWIISDSMDIFGVIEECVAAWSASGLEEALQSISNGYDGSVKTLLQSMKAIHDLDLESEFSLQEPVCRLSLLPPRIVADMKTVDWNGEPYLLPLANFWANRVSCEPPMLPNAHVGS